ncbi:O-antigen ligase family protein [Gammaproteobacteria bacterium]|nr:O-antigen ligase family protein [Gammaproteobacteria bacterium]
MVATLFSISRFMCFFLGLSLLLKQKLSNFNIGLFAFLLVIALSTFLHSGTIIPVISITIDVVTLMVFLDYGLSWNSKQTIKILANVLNAMCIIGFLTTIIWPNGLWLDVEKGTKLFLLGGNYNSIGPRFLMALIINALYYEKQKSWLPVVWGMILLAYISIWTVGSMTSLVGVSLFTLYLIVRTRWSIDKVYVWMGFLVLVTAQLVFVFMHNEANVNPLSTYFVENVLGKSSDFTFRTGIWIRSTLLFKKSFWLGYGFQNVDFYYAMIDGRTPHNYILNILLKGGIVGLTIFSLWIYSAVSRAHRLVNQHSNLLEIGTLIIFIMLLMEVYPFLFIFILVYLLYKSPDL